jgi:DNA polymerase-3 subunit epsilon
MLSIEQAFGQPSCRSPAATSRRHDREHTVAQAVPQARRAVQTRLDERGVPLLDTTFVVLDLETTGLRPGEDRITEVGAVKVRGGDVLGEFQTLVHPGRAVPPAITTVTGISTAMLTGAPPVGAVLPSLLEFLRGAVLVAHNARFDVSFLDAELARSGRPRLACDVVDTARLGRRLVRDEVRDLRLATLANHFRSRVRPSHRALQDARATVDVLHGLLERAGTIGATTLEDLLDLQSSRSEHAFRKVGLVADAPHAPGVYRFLDADDRVLYVGKAGDLRQRLRRYFGQDERRRMDAMVREAARVEWDVTPTELEAAVREVRELVATRPRFNRRSTQPERAAWVRWSDEAFPRLQVVRDGDPGRGPVLGPVGGARRATALLEAVQEVVPVRRCTGRIRLAQDHPTCVLKELGRCGSPCDGTIDAAAYRAQTAPAAALVAGDADVVVAALQARMLELAGEARFEDAGRVRARLHALAEVVVASRRVTALVAVPHLVVARTADEVVDVVRVRHGRLVGTARVPVGLATRERLARVADALPDRDVAPGPPLATDHEEIRLVSRWLDGPGAWLLVVEGTWTEPVAGGAVANATADEARVVARRTRRDAVTLSGRKVRESAAGAPPAARRSEAQTSSNQFDHASGAGAEPPGSRPSHVARTR